jgi:uncharacterized membrane-anchored protein YitT (DUF2179 family)
MASVQTRSKQVEEDESGADQGGNVLKIVKELLLIILGCFIVAFSINMLIVPSNLLTAGVTGICIMVYHFTGWATGTQYLIYNIPLLLFGYKHLGKKFCLYTIFAVVVQALLLNVVHFNYQMTNDRWLAILFGAVLMSGGGALVLRSSGSLGGLDIIGRIIVKRTQLSFGRFNLLINGIIVVISGFLFDLQTAMYTLVFIGIISVASDLFLNHVNRLSIWIVTDRGDEIAASITKNVHRGVTKVNGTGTYTQSDKDVLLCVIVKAQLPELREIVQTIDPHAFINVTPTQQVFGRFMPFW